MIGTTISHYKILNALGQGGMGEVYLAQDTKLERQVALKFLPKHLTADKEARERFEREAKAAAALNHPNIVTIHEIGEHEGQVFIAMEYVEGQTLKEMIPGVGARRDAPSSGDLSLPITQIIDIAIQIGQGLAVAHAKGIIHRDIKPQNILIDKNGSVKILDFGLAKLKGVSPLTKEASTLGTVHYMSPEQTLGKEVDHRTDIWSLGVVLYEMLTGQLPFKGEYEQAVIYAVLNEHPEPLKSLRLDVPTELGQVAEKSLQKDPGNRYQSSSEFLKELNQFHQGISAPETVAVRFKRFLLRPKVIVPALLLLCGIVTAVVFYLKHHPSMQPPHLEKSIAVLPFTNMSPDPGNEYFSDGLAEELINALSKLEGLHVTARTSAFLFRGKDIDIRDIGKKLNVGSVLEGSVRKAGNRLRITAQLINVADGYHLWSERYDRELDDVFAVQDDISLAIVNALKIKLLGKEREQLVRRYTDNLEAYDLYLKGRYYLNTLTEEGISKSLDYFQQTIQKDPNYALAYFGVGCFYFLRSILGQRPTSETMPRAKSEFLKAIELDDSIAEVHAWLGDLYLQYEWDWSSAEKELKKAIELKPNSPEAHQFYADYLSATGHLYEAVAEAERAMKLDPLSTITHTILIAQLYASRQFKRVIEHCREVLTIEPSFLAQVHLWRALRRENRLNEALAECKVFLSLFAGREVVEAMDIGYAESGFKGAMRAAAQNLVEQSKIRYVTTYTIATFFAYAEDDDQTLHWLEQAYEERSQYLYNIGAEPDWDRVRAHPRFIALLKKIGLTK